MKHVLAVGALAAGGALVALTTPAQADPPEHAKAHDVVSQSTGADTKAEQRAVRKYWTAKRMRNAVPRDVVRPTGKPSGNGKPTKPGGSGDGSLGSVWPNQQKTVGKVFFKLGSTSYVCSGNAVDWSGDSRNTVDVVSTAGHCVNDGGTKFATDFMFVPGYDGTKSGTAARPSGTFVASKVYTSSQWAAQGSNKWDHDIGFARVTANSYGTLEGAVGSTDLDFTNDPKQSNTTYTINVHSFGYPAARPYDGRKLISCWGATTNDYVGGSGDYRLPCNMTGGSSGGPWLVDGVVSDGRPQQVSVNSFGYQGEKNAMYGPALGSVAASVYTSAATG